VTGLALGQIFSGERSVRDTEESPSNDGDTVDSTTSNLRSTSRYLEFAWLLDFAMVQAVSLR